MIKVRVAPTSANLGPGFDCLAVTLDLGSACMETTYEMTGDVIEVIPSGWGENSLPRGKTNLMVQAFDYYAAQMHSSAIRGMKIHSHNGIPVGSGLGSSAAAIVSGLLAARAFYLPQGSNAALLNMALELEGHADNTTAALLGGLVVLTVKDHKVISRSYPVARLPVVIVRPDFQLSTPVARQALPGQVAFEDAVMNIGQTALTIEALRSGDLDLLGKVCCDRIHQRYRLPLIPGAAQAVEFGREAGASTVVLSGAGSSLLAFTATKPETVASAMQAAFTQVGLSSEVMTGWTANLPAVVEIIP